MSKEQNLMDRIRKGDDEAFSLLVEEFLSSAFKTAYLVLRSKELAEDAIQNALEDCYISIMRNKDIRNIKAWFYRLVYSRSIDIYRKNSRVSFTTIDENPKSISRLKSKSAQEQAIQKENTNEMMNLIMSLQEDQSVPILLHYYEGMSIKEIGLVLSENVNTVKTRLSRGRKKLADMMERKEIYPLEVNSYGL